MTLTKQLTYRLDFFIARTRNLMFLLLFYSVWKSLTAATGFFAAWSANELIRYVLAVHILRSFIFGSQLSTTADEIARGEFSFYLVRPITYFWVYYAREFADRSLATTSAMLEVFIVCLITKFNIISDLTTIRLFVIILTIIGAHYLYAVANYCLNLLAFWSHEVGGPRFLFDWSTELASGTFFPLAIIGGAFAALMNRLPTALLVYEPVLIYLQKIPRLSTFQLLGHQALWLIIFSVLACLLWKKGLRKYSSPGL